jgi:1,4-alpha-glucan branching enzyme
LVLHAHLPFVRHPEHPFFLEEDWLYEALTETYLPLLGMLHDIEQEGVPWRLAITLSPTLLNMLEDELLRKRYEERLASLSALAERECKRTRAMPAERLVAEHYRAEIRRVRGTWERLEGRVARGFAELARGGSLEILTCAATHGYLPLLRVTPEAVRAQIAVGVAEHQRILGRAPEGIWLPECGYFEGLDRLLARFGLRYFLTDAHGVLHARPRPRFGTAAPVVCPASGVAAFGRDRETAKQVWSKDEGYPGDPVYREFYRDIGYDLDIEYIGPWVQPDGRRKNTGFKYHRITGQGEDKAPYDPEVARARAEVHAENFVVNRERQVEHLGETLGQAPIIVAPYDAELFGHWWYEGPWWLSQVIRKTAERARSFGLTHPSEFLRLHPRQQVAQPAESSWGDQGYHGFWLDDANAWIYPHLHRASERMVELAMRFPIAEGLQARALRQAARELLLAQSSDWAFILKSGTVVDYARERTRSHLRRFTRLYQDLVSDALDERWVGQVEALDNLFPTLDHRVYARRAPAAAVAAPMKGAEPDDPGS